MQAQKTLALGDQVYTSYQTGVHTRHDGSMRRFELQHGPVIKGNFKSPYPWSYSITYAKFETGTVQVTYLYGPNRYYDTWAGFNPGANDPWSPKWSDTRQANFNQALDRLNEKVRGSLDLGVSLAEIGQTKRMFQSVGKMANWANLSGFGTGRDLANGWLQWQYGWRPLMQDVFDAANEGLNIALHQIRNLSASGKSRLKGSGPTPEGLIYLIPWYTIAEGSGKSACRIHITIDLPGATLDRWSSLNPVSLAWELTPYSFVVDWVYDVGSALRACETAFLYERYFKSGYVSELFAYDGSESTGYQRKPNPAGNPPTIYENFGMTKSIKRREFNRSVLSHYPFPYLPQFKVKLGAERLLSLASLLGQKIGSPMTRGFR